MPYLYATALDWSLRMKCQFTTEGVYGNGELTSVAAHVQADTIPDAMRPGLTLRDALQNSSEFFGEYAVYRA
jgi:hypothetical protein